MTPKEYAKGIVAFQSSMGTANAHVTTYINTAAGRDAAIRAAVYSNWPSGDAEFEVQADTFTELFDAVKAKWIEHAAKYRAEMIRKMALKIITITANIGHCTDAALRGTFEFSEKDVTTYGAEACAEANEIAGKGPFEIVTLGGANGAPDTTEDRNPAHAH